MGRSRVRRPGLLVLTMNPIIIHLSGGEIADVECAGDLLQPIIIVEHVAQELAKYAPSAVESPEGLVLIQVAEAGHAEKPTDEWADWAAALI